MRLIAFRIVWFTTGCMFAWRASKHYEKWSSAVIIVTPGEATAAFGLLSREFVGWLLDDIDVKFRVALFWEQGDKAIC